VKSSLVKHELLRHDTRAGGNIQAPLCRRAWRFSMHPRLRDHAAGLPNLVFALRPYPAWAAMNP
jgi:hypothetical protein